MTPLVSVIRDVLDEGGAMRPELIRKALRKRGQSVQQDRIERLLKDHDDLFRPAGADGWDLAERTITEAPTRTSSPTVDPMLGDELLEGFVVLDLETTGTDPDADEVVQLAAIRYRSGHAVAALHFHVRPSSAVLSESLRVRMGWERVPDDVRVELAVAVDALDRFVGADVAVAWNARFDLAFLGLAGWQPQRAVDALAVSMLAQPVGPHGLSDQVKRLLEHQPDWPGDLPVEGHPPAGDQPHDALYDCLLTGDTFARATDILGQGIGVAADLVGLNASSAPERRPTTPPLPVLQPTTAADVLARAVAALGHEERDAQSQVTQATADALAGEGALVEAPTGTGKTLGYLAAAMAAASNGYRVALITAYKNLQDQLLDEFTHLTQALGATVPLAVLKGSANYLCSRRLQRVIDDLAVDDQESRFVCAVLLRLLDRELTTTREDVPGWLLASFPRARGILDDVATGCAHATCGRRLALDQANAAKLVVLNQVLWLDPPQRLTPTDTVVIDEAHDLESMATLAYTIEIGTQPLTAFANRLKRGRNGGLLPALKRHHLDTAAAIHLTDRLRTAVAQAYEPLFEFARALSGDVDDEHGGQVRLRRSPWILHPAAWTAPADNLRYLHTTLKSLSGELAALADAVADDDLREETWAIFEDLREADDQLYRLLDVRDHNAVHYLEVSLRDGWRFAQAPVEVATVLRERWDELAGYLLISATLQSGPNDFTFLVNRLGLPETVRTHAIGSDLPFDQNVVFGVSRWLGAIPTPRFMPEFEAQTADELRTLATIGQGRLLGLFTATRRVLSAADAIGEDLARSGIPVLAQGSGARARLLAEFKEREESVLLGTRSFWQGVDVPGPSLSFVAIEKLPFPHLRDPITEARLDALRRRARNEFDEYLLPLATIAFKQGFGRLIRGRHDRGLVLLLDRRFHTKGYQDQVLGALPGFQPRNIEAETSQRAFYQHLDRALPGLFGPSAIELIDALPDQRSAPQRRHLVGVGGDRDERRPAVLVALKEIFGFDGFRTTEQEELFWRIHDGEDVLGLLPTGAGKSLPFQLAALVGEGVTLVVSPLVALMRDQVEQLLEKGIRDAAALVGAMSADEREEILRLAEDGAIRLLYASPERLRDPVFLDALSRMPLQRVVVDEAHCVSLWGPSFRPDFLTIRPAMEQTGHGDVPVAALTATATPDIEVDIRSRLDIGGAHKVAMPFARPELRFAVLGPRSKVPADIFHNDKQRVRMLIRILLTAERNGHCALVYVPTVVRAEEITAQLTHMGLIARAYHGRLDGWQRESVENLFREGELDVVVATKAFGMGIDRPDVRYVIHLGYPSDLESYYQEAGRAGRDGQPSWCLLLTLDRDRRTPEWFIDQVSDLDGVLATAAAELRPLGPGTHLVDLDELAQRLDLDETGSRVVLHYLEAGGLLQRLTDQVVTARVLRLVDDLPDQLVPILGDIPVRVGVSLDLEGVQRDTGLSVVEVEQRLLAAAREGHVVFRPYRRKAVVVIGDAVPTHADTGPIVAEMRRKLDQMEAYAQGRLADRCRANSLQRYLGDQPTETCGHCDLCDPQYARPWMATTLDLIPRADTLLDPELVTLAAVEWNAKEIQAGRSPYGRTALVQVLAGDSFGLGRYVEGAERRRRVGRAEASPYWGALRLLTNPAKQIERAIDALGAKGHVGEAVHEPTNVKSDGPRMYSYLQLTDVGRRHLEGSETGP